MDNLWSFVFYVNNHPRWRPLINGLPLLIAVNSGGYRCLYLLPAGRDEHLGHCLGVGIIEVVEAEESPGEGIVGVLLRVERQQVV